jgi:CII-binding regulator of phage lambda lysogenization HflD
MEREEVIKVVNDVKNKPNKDLVLALMELDNEFKQTKELIIELTRHIDNVENSYNIVNNELNSRYIK